MSGLLRRGCLRDWRTGGRSFGLVCVLVEVSGSGGSTVVGSDAGGGAGLRGRGDVGGLPHLRRRTRRRRSSLEGWLRGRPGRSRGMRPNRRKNSTRATKVTQERTHVECREFQSRLRLPQQRTTLKGRRRLGERNFRRWRQLTFCFQCYHSVSSAT